MPAQRRTDEQYRREVTARVTNVKNGAFGGLEQGVLQQQVVDGVGRQSELGKHDQVDALGIALLRQLDRRLRVACRVGRRDHRRGSGDPHHAVPVDAHEVR